MKKILYLIGGLAVLVLVAMGGMTLLGRPTETPPSSLETSDTSSPGVANQNPSSGTLEAPKSNGQAPRVPFWGMKLVNDTVTDADLDAMKAAGIGIVEGEWGMGDADAKATLSLLNRLQARGLKLIMNFTDEYAWGYQEGDDPVNQKPVWQKTSVEAYERAIMKHTALFGYDISNEAGENLPNGDTYRITAAQMKEASATVRAIDPARPVLMRMHYWDRFDGDFTNKNPFASGIADIVMLNLYSNWTEDGVKAYFPDMLATAAESLADKVRGVDPKARIWIALGAFKEAPTFLRPSATDLGRDIRAALAVRSVENISFFGWGPERYPDQGPGWYLPRDGADLLDVIRSFAKSGS